MNQEELEQKKEKLKGLFTSPQYKPMKLKELAILLDVPKDRRQDLEEVLKALMADGVIGISSKGKYGKNMDGHLTGTFMSTEQGYGFVRVEGEPEDVFISRQNTAQAMEGDVVSLQILPSIGFRGHKREGKIIRIQQHAVERVVGTYEKNGKSGFVVPDNRKLHIDVYIPAGKEMGAVTGHKVVAGLTSYGDDRHKPEGVITEILGHQNDPGTDILSVIKAYDLPYAFPPDVMEEVARIPQVVLPSEKEGRRDLRHLLTITIDGEDAKDLDDAVTLEIKGQAHFLLGVHIADVTHYVRENTKLDQEAYLRGTSCYLVDRVIPMLPHRLSNGICSLNVGEDRLALSCLMEIDNQGHVVDHEIVESLIHVDRRMSYTEVYALFTQDEKRNQLKAENPPLLDMLLQMRECASFLRKARMKRGALDFDFPEAKIRLNAKGIPVEIYPYVHNEATGLIEDFMIAANETVAEDFYWRGVPFLYRNHEKPDEEKMEQFIAFLHHYGITLHPQNREVHPKELQKVMEKIKGTEEELLLSRLMLRALRQARYAPERLGHYGLASKYYTHFTSPIRRYPDLQIHRIIKACLRHTLTEKQQNRLEKRMPEVGIHTSMTERRADEVEREVEKIKKAQYMENHIGEIFTGVISGVTNYGLYVELSNTVEGFIHVSRLKGDYFHFDSESYALVGEMTNRRFQLGQKVQVRVENADHFIPQVEFSPAGEPMENRITGKKNGKRQH